MHSQKSRTQQPSQPRPRRNKGEIAELQEHLNQTNMKEKKEAVRKIIDAMTRGKDVSILFPEIVKNMETPDMELKKLIYLYILNYAKKKPHLSILAVNTFRKDAANKQNPFLRGLAIRTMGCMRIQEMLEYLLTPLDQAIKDEDSYVKKTAAICIGKMFDFDPQFMEQRGYLDKLAKLADDGNAMVVSNAIAIQQRISTTRGDNLVNLDQYKVKKLLTALGDCNEWGSIYILNAIADYVTKDNAETEQILERISPRLSHQNPGVVLAALRLIMKYIDFLSNLDTIRLYTRKLAGPLVSLLQSNYHEIQYIALKNANLILQKKPNLLEKELKIFFCNFNDPIYIKMQKLDILIKLANNENIHQILFELKEYIQEVDVEYVKRAVYCIGRCAIKLEKSSEKCVTALQQHCLAKGKQPYIIQEAIIVMRDIFRKYPRKYEQILADICDNMNNLEDPVSKASMIWIIGEYVETIDNSPALLTKFAQNFLEEPAVIQHQIILSCLKLFLKRPQEGYDLITEKLGEATKKGEHPDVRDRAYIYWRILEIDQALAEEIVYSQRPIISDDAYTLESDLLDKLIENIGCLSSVYFQPPEKFVKKLRDCQNLKEQEELEEIAAAGEEFLQGIEDSTQPSYEEQAPEKTSNLSESNIMGDNQITSSVYQSQVQPQTADDLLGGDDLINSVIPGQQQQQQLDSNITTNQGIVNNSPNIRTPYEVVLDANSYGQKKEGSGLQVEAAFQAEAQTTYLYIRLSNQSQITYNNFQVKFNFNAFRLQPVNMALDIQQLTPGAVQESKVEINNLGGPDTSGQPPSCPFVIQTAINTNIDMFVFQVPCNFSCIVRPVQMSQQQYQEIVQKQIMTTITVSSSLSQNPEQFKQKMQDNNLVLLKSQKNDGGIEMATFGGSLINGMTFAADVIIDSPSSQLRFRIISSIQVILSNIEKTFENIINL